METAESVTIRMKTGVEIDIKEGTTLDDVIDALTKVKANSSEVKSILEG